jgi:predicted  nucleic acid-binding Zn-ribbon protein
MTEEQTQGTEQTKSIQELDRIRDIIFGPQMRDYQQRFQQIVRDTERLQQDLSRLSEQLTEQGNDQTKKLQALRREMREANDDLRAELRQSAEQLTSDKVSRASLGELFVELGTRLKSGGSLTDLLENLVEADQGKDRGAA